MTQKDILVLFLISSEPGVRGINTLMRIFEKADFTENFGRVLDGLLRHDLIAVAKLHPNGTAVSYKATKKGMEFIQQEFRGDDILGYILTLEDPTFLHELTKAYIDKYHQSREKLN